MSAYGITEIKLLQQKIMKNLYWSCIARIEDIGALAQDIQCFQFSLAIFCIAKAT